MSTANWKDETLATSRSDDELLAFLREHNYPQEYLTQNVSRRELADILTSHGFTMSYQTLTDLCMPSHKPPRGPPVAFYWGNRTQHNLAVGLWWAWNRAEAQTKARIEELRLQYA
jgi:hypothetical protein